MGQPAASLPPFPLTPHWNPQQDLFPGLLPGRAQEGTLRYEQWQDQEARLLRHHYTRTEQAAVERAARIRPPADAPRQCESYSWSWPDYTSLAIHLPAASRRLADFAVTRLQEEEELAAYSELLQEIAQQIGFALSRPCPVYRNFRQVRIEWLDCIAWVANCADRELYMELRDREGHWQRAARGFDLFHALGDGLWLQQALLPWLPTIERRFGWRASEAHRLLLRDLRGHFLARRFTQATSKQLFVCLRARPELLQLTLRLHRYRPVGEVSSVAYAKLWRHAAYWQELERISPRLTLFCYLAERRQRKTEYAHLGELRDDCLELGLSPAGWRFLCRHGEAAYAPWLRPADSKRGLEHFEVLIAWIEWQAQAGLQQPLSAEFARVIAAAQILGRDEEGYYAVMADPRFARVAANDFPAGQDGKPDEATRAEWQEVATWLAVARPELDRHQWRAGWPLLQRAHRSWEQRLIDARWDCPVATVSIDGWSARALSNGKDLAEEGERMKHCVINYVDRCLAGGYQVFTVEHPDNGEPVATIGLKKYEDGWEIDQVQGQRNSEAPAEALVLAVALQEKFEDL